MSRADANTRARLRDGGGTASPSLPPSPETVGAHYLPAARFKVFTPLYDLLCRALGLGAALRRFELACLGGLSFTRALDVGCGTGELLRMLAPLRPEATFIGADVDPDVLTIARAKLTSVGSRVTLLEARADALPLPSSSFDLVISSMMLHHLDTATKVSALREWRRVLSPGGALLLVDLGVPRPCWLKLLLWPLRFPILEEQADNFRGRVPDLLAAAGFTFVETGVYRSVVVAYTARSTPGERALRADQWRQT